MFPFLKNNRQLTFALFLVLFTVAYFAGLKLTMAYWSGATQTAPLGNVPALLNILEREQSKSGALFINNGNASLPAITVDYGKMGVGIENPASNLHLAINGKAGAIQYCQNGSSCQTPANIFSSIKWNYMTHSAQKNSIFMFKNNCPSGIDGSGNPLWINVSNGSGLDNRFPLGATTSPALTGQSSQVHTHKYLKSTLYNYWPEGFCSGRPYYYASLHDGYNAFFTTTIYLPYEFTDAGYYNIPFANGFVNSCTADRTQCTLCVRYSVGATYNCTETRTINAVSVPSGLDPATYDPNNPAPSLAKIPFTFPATQSMPPYYGVVFCKKNY